MSEASTAEFNRFSIDTRADEAAKIPQNESWETGAMLIKSVEDASKAYPELANAVLLSGKGELLFATPTVMQQLAQADSQKVDEARQRITDEAAQYQTPGTRAKADNIAGVPVTLITLADSAHQDVKYPGSYTRDMAAAATIDLMIGAIIFKNNADGVQAYAALRHAQRYPGQKTDYEILRQEAMAADVINTGSTDRYAPGAVEGAMELAGIMGKDMAAVSPADLREMAENIADKTVPHGVTLQGIEDALAGITDYSQRTTDTPEQKRKNTCTMMKQVETYYARAAEDSENAVDVRKRDVVSEEVHRLAKNFLAGPGTKAFMVANAPGAAKSAEHAHRFITLPAPKL